MSDHPIVCPFCETGNLATARTCAQCGQSMICVCPRCSTVNAVTAENCSTCGQQFDALGQIMARHAIRFTDRFTRQAEDAIEVKQQETMQANQRTNQFWEQERQRQAVLAAQQHRQKMQERRLIISVVVVAIAVVVVIALLSIIR